MLSVVRGEVECKFGRSDWFGESIVGQFSGDKKSAGGRIADRIAGQLVLVENCDFLNLTENAISLSI